MSSTSALDRVTAVVLRYMRPPVFVLIGVYTVGVIGMALIPGQDAAGNPSHMTLFEAFYFFTYTATTTGFGEIPHEFTSEQRLWTIFCLYMGVIAWLYAIGSIIKLIQNPHFLRAFAERNFAAAVARLREPYYIICGFGDTGSLLARGLDENFITSVVIDIDEERVKALALRDYQMPTPGLCADAGIPGHLLGAGVKADNCLGVVVLNRDEDAALRIAVIARTLNPQVPILVRSTSKRHQALFDSLEGVTPVDPFRLFAEQLGSAVTAPRVRTLEEWMVGAHGADLRNPQRIPLGTWFLCGYGRMGRWIHHHLAQQDIPLVVIDPELEEATDNNSKISAHADPQTLHQAGFEQAAGIVCGTRTDSENIAILLAARAINADAFAIVRQNHHVNHLAMQGARADLIMQPSLVTARKLLLQLIAPMSDRLLDHLREQDPEVSERLTERLHAAVGDEKPTLWSQPLSSTTASAAVRHLEHVGPLVLGDLLKDPRDPDRQLACVPLALCREDREIMLPEDLQSLCPQDQILFCGTRKGRYLLQATLNNDATLHFLVTGEEPPRGYFFQWLDRKLEPNIGN